MLSSNNKHFFASFFYVIINPNKLKPLNYGSSNFNSVVEKRYIK